MILLKLNESSASLRVVPLPPLVRVSDSTSAATNESGRTFYFSMGGVDYGSGGSLSAVSEAMGLYACCFSTSKISITGPGMVYYGLPTSSLTALQVSAPFMVVPVDSYDSMRFGLFALPNAAAEASGGLITHGTGTGQLHTSAGSVGLKAGTHSEVTIQGVTRVNSGVTLNANTHSGATIQGLSNYANISNVTLHAGTHSGATVQGVSNYANLPLTSIATSVWSALRSEFTTPGSFGEYVYSQVTGTSTGTVQGVTRALNLSANGDKTGYSISGTKTTLDALNDIDGSGVTLHAGTHSGATVQGLSNYANISAVTLHAGTHSAATIAGIVDGGIVASTLASGVITTAKFAAGAIDAAALATDAVSEIADGLLNRNIEGGSSTGRLVKEALYPLRNKSIIEGSVGTVFAGDDSTSAWTFAPSLGTAPIAGIDPT